jgi:hypothetical protein
LASLPYQAAAIEVVPPGVRLPDAEVLLADGDLTGQSLGVEADQLGEGVALAMEGAG